jgi:carboxyl-terminal processing protease
MTIQLRGRHLLIVVAVAVVLGFSAGRSRSSHFTPERFGDLVVQAGRTDNGAGSAHEPEMRHWEMLYEVMNNIDKHFVRTKVNQREITYGAVRGMLKSLNDKYTRFLTPEEYDDFKVKNDGEFFGIGASIFVEEDPRTNEESLVLVPIEDSPAEKAGLKTGDTILKIDGTPTKNMAVQAAVSHIRGPRGTKVTLSIQRKGAKPMEPAVQKEVTIVRDLIQIPAVKAELLADGIGWIQLRDFNEKADRELDRAYAQLKEKGLNGLVLDLRGNPGGLLEVAINVASRFIKNGTIVRTEGRSGNEDHAAEADRYWNVKVPVVVLINGFSASASEIVAGAVQDKKVGKIVGETSYGKASVQLLVKLKNGGALALTTARYLTPNGRDISEKGVVPDVVVEQPRITAPPPPNAEKPEKKDVQLDKAVELIKTDMGKTGNAAKASTASSKSLQLAL